MGFLSHPNWVIGYASVQIERQQTVVWGDDMGELTEELMGDWAPTDTEGDPLPEVDPLRDEWGEKLDFCSCCCWRPMGSAQ